MTERKFTDARIKLVGNGYLITATNGEAEVQEQFVAGTLEEVGSVLKAIMAPPPELNT